MINVSTFVGCGGGGIGWETEVMISSDWQPVTYLRDKALQRGDLILSSPHRCHHHHCISLFSQFSFCLPPPFFLSFSSFFDAVSCPLSMLCLAPVSVSKQSGLLAQKRKKKTFAKVDGKIKVEFFSRFLFILYICIQYFTCQLQCNLHLFIV